MCSSDDAQREHAIIVSLVAFGEARGFEMGRLGGARAGLRCVLAARKLALGAEAEARVDACAAPATLERWLTQAAVATSGGPVLIEDPVELDADRGRLEAGRSILRRVLSRRNLVPNASGEALIDACTDLGTLERWQHQAIFAVSVADALRSPETPAGDTRREHVLTTDLVNFGEDMGFEKGWLDGARSALRCVLAAPKLVLGADAEAQVDGCTDRATLERWLAQAAVAASTGEVLQ